MKLCGLSQPVNGRETYRSTDVTDRRAINIDLLCDGRRIEGDGLRLSITLRNMLFDAAHQREYGKRVHARGRI